MDLPDSSSSSSVTSPSRDTSSPDDDGALSVAAAQAKEAKMLFHSGKYVECLDILRQLLQKKKDDPQILQNIAITEFFQAGCLDSGKLLQTLNGIKKRANELARAWEEHVESGGNLGSEAALGSKGTNNTVCQLSATNCTVLYDNEIYMSLTILNMAIICFHLQEYSKAYSLLEPLYQKIEPIDEGTALNICLLYLDVALASRDPWKTIDVINYVEKSYCVNNLINQGDNGSSVQQHHQSSNLVAKSPSSSLPSNSTTIDASNMDSVASADPSENSFSRSLSEEYETLLSTIDNSAQSLARSSGLLLSYSNDISNTIDLRLKLHLYKVRFLLFTKNLKAAKREIKMAMNMARGQDSSMALVLKSQLEYARGNYRKSIKLLMGSSNQMEIGMSSIYNNNIGCIYYQLGKYHTSSVFFSKALRNSSSRPREGKSIYILYNCGMQYLACGKPILAARCFLKASSVFYNGPLLWLRIAECCILALEKGLLKSKKSEVKVHVIGKGRWRQLVVDGGSDNSSLCNDRELVLSMSLARQSLCNALHLLNCSELKYSRSGFSMEEELREYEDNLRRENCTIKQAILADLAYVELELGDPLKALATARSLLRLPECSRLYFFMGNIYAAECLCLLNRPMEAAAHLLIYLSGGNNAGLPYSEEDCKNYLGDGAVFLRPDEARGALHVNLSVFFAIQGDLKRAYHYAVHALSTIPNSPEAIITAIYVDLMLGNTRESLAKLKQCSHIRFLPNR